MPLQVEVTSVTCDVSLILFGLSASVSLSLEVYLSVVIAIDKINQK